MTLIDHSTELPAKVRLFFQIDAEKLNAASVSGDPDFEIYENGLRISEFESQSRIRRERGEFLYSSVLLLDLSGSVLFSDLTSLKEAASSFIERTIPHASDDLYGTREMAIYWFDGAEDLHLLVPFTEDREELLTGIASITDQISEDPSTNLNGAVIKGLKLMEQRVEEMGDKLEMAIAGSVVLFTDGTDQAARNTTAQALDAVNNASVEHSIFTIGLGSEIDNVILSRLGKNGFEMATDSLELKEKFLAVAERLERQANSYYVLEYCSPKRAGTHKLRLNAIYEKFHGSFETVFSAEGFTGGCKID